MNKGPQEGVYLKTNKEANVSEVRVIKGVRKAIEGIVKNCKDFVFCSEATIFETEKPLDRFEQRRDMT